MITKSSHGRSIALSDDALTMVIGSPGNQGGIGCVFIYTRDTMKSPWIGSNPLRGTGYKGKPRQGTSVSLSADGNTLAIGGPGDDQEVGAVWMFRRSDNIVDRSWYQTQEKLSTVPENDGQHFGLALNLSGDGMTLAVGIPMYKYYRSKISSGLDPIGAVRIFTIDSASGIWKIDEHKLIGSVTYGFKSEQGTSVSLSYDGKILAIGGYGNNTSGDIWIFIKYYGNWIEQDHKVFISVDEHGGRDVSISGDGKTLVFGSYNKRFEIGGTTIFFRYNNKWVLNHTYTGGDNLHTPCLSRDGSYLAHGVIDIRKRDCNLFIKLRDRRDNWIDIVSPLRPGIYVYDDIYLKTGYPVVMSGNSQCVAVGFYKYNSDMGAVITYTLLKNAKGYDEWHSDFIIVPEFAGRPGQGKSIVLSEDRLMMVSGGYLDKDGIGSCWVFTRDNVETDSWKQYGDKLIPKDPIGKSLYGYSLAISLSGNTLVVGGPGDNNNMGAVWVYIKGSDSDGWIFQKKLIESSPHHHSLFGPKYGTSVSISDDLPHQRIRVVTGGPDDNSRMGGVLVFDRVESIWTQTAIVEPAQSGVLFAGVSVSISSDGKKLAVGCPGNGIGSVLFYNYVKNSWVLDNEKIIGPSIKISKQGSSISMDGKCETLVVGGPDDELGVGATWIFNRINNKWVFKTKIVCPDSIGPSKVGSSVKINSQGTYLIIGGPGDNNSTGAAWAYKLLDGNWTYLDEKYVGIRHKGQAAVGYSVAIIGTSDPMIAIGGPLDDEGVGAVWIDKILDA